MNHLRITDLRSQEALDGLYRESSDPWNVRGDMERQERYEAVFRMLGAARFNRVVDLGCGEGTVTARLSAVAEEVIGVDISPEALRIAATRCPRARLLQADLRQLPDGVLDGADLIALLDCIMFLPREDQREVLGRARRSGARWTLVSDRIVPREKEAHFCEGHDFAVPEDFVSLVAETWHVEWAVPVQIQIYLYPPRSQPLWLKPLVWALRLLIGAGGRQGYRLALSLVQALWSRRWGRPLARWFVSHLCVLARGA